MSEAAEAGDGTALYKKFIDELVELARGDISAARIEQYGHAERTNDDAMPLSINEIRRKHALLTMSSEQRRVVMELLEHSRSSAVHDVLSHLEWMQTCGGLDFVQNGVKYPEDPCFGAMHYDFVARSAGDAWPDE